MGNTQHQSLLVAVLVGRETILLVALVFGHAHIRKAANRFTGRTFSDIFAEMSFLVILDRTSAATARKLHAGTQLDGNTKSPKISMGSLQARVAIGGFP
jgi:hypothetical protein